MDCGSVDHLIPPGHTPTTYTGLSCLCRKPLRAEKPEPQPLPRPRRDSVAVKAVDRFRAGHTEVPAA